jgi:hypothetical protein
MDKLSMNQARFNPGGFVWPALLRSLIQASTLKLNGLANTLEREKREVDEFNFTLFASNIQKLVTLLALLFWSRRN